MKFRTEVEIPISEKKIQISGSLFSIGSCFATEISVKLADSQFQTLNNPFGTLFNPWAVKNSIQEIFENKIFKIVKQDYQIAAYLRGRADYHRKMIRAEQEWENIQHNVTEALFGN